MKERFAKPTLEVVTFDVEDVIVTSGGCPTNCRIVCNSDCQTVCTVNCTSVG